MIEDSKHKPQLIGERITLDTAGDDILLLEQYHGIKVRSYDPMLIDNSTIMQTIYTEINKGYPICTSIKGENIPWSFSNEKQNYYPFLIVGYDDTEQNVYCLDVHYLNEVSKIPYEVFLLGYRGMQTFSISHDEYSTLDWRGIISKITCKLNNSDAFRKMKEVSNFLRNAHNYMICNRENLNTGDIDLVEKIQNLHRSRFLFSRTLDYFVNYHNAKPLKEYSEKFIKISDRWLCIWTIINKSIYKNNFEAKREIVAEKINELAELEENVCKQLTNIIDTSDDLTFIQVENNDDILEDLEVVQLEGKDVCYIDISAYFNNKGFSLNLNSNSKADLTGIEEFILAEGLPNNQYWDINNIKFQFPILTDTDNDNISCSKQSISFPEGQYSYIVFVGCAEWGNQSAELVLNYCEENVEVVTFNMSDWSLSTPLYGESVVWEGNSYHRTKSGIELIEWFKGHIFAKVIKLKNEKKLDSITLPDCNNIHIFSLSLYK
ncbi:hypothetical protein [Anaerocolumna cellulosilytica]|uniref:hypothetical protein n=1 Tax=Anaerocolumna cellulosilytica TaxID=433286 RepID=UPI001609ACD7|nr:hypothetical protein [Anaerocolumna cellulosilytica]MBB5196283.1 hypothetical protein [Anaerocolumna cellulosilytica]